MFAYCENDAVNRMDVTGRNFAVYNWVNKDVAYSIFRIPDISPKKNQIFYNCYGLAIDIYSGYDYKIKPGFLSGKNKYSGYVSVKKIAKRVIADLKVLGRKGKIVSGPNIKCKNNEYLIAVRVTSKKYKKAGVKYYDFHFMRKYPDGIWRFKAGWYGPIFELRRGLTPDDVTWDWYKKKSYVSNEYIAYQTNVYTSKTIYIKVTI